MNLSMQPNVKPPSLGMLIILFFLLIAGIGCFVLVGNMLSHNNTPTGLAVLFYLGTAAWILSVLAILVYQVFHFKPAKNAASMPGNSPMNRPASDEGYDPMQQLRKLEAMRHEGLIDDEEFHRRRQEIIDKKA